MASDYQSLKARHRAEREAQHQHLALRLHRSLSWLHAAEEMTSDPDGRFIFLWIAFNAAYATEIDDREGLSEQRAFRAFLEKLVSLDRKGAIAELVWNEFSGSIRLLLDNQYVFQDFWSFQNGAMTEEEWRRRFNGARKAARRALAERDTVTVLSIVLSRIYVLRNQLVHGGATWHGKVNRNQIRDCVALLAKLVPVIIETMMDHPGETWGVPTYPVVDHE